ncbi:T9SS type A sorting domain-containing protein [bacterium]|nr:T9SS type A sorting domain-containing protein [bacterium]NIN91612.1 T9SS type A sorting domain-containing protein [bacterium]NIO17976.1 T9SS type A sorting domain-containing protein [bacterium]NIO73744.1 T9SS type A sorting domain-containing protein [bacterium]
MRRFALIAILVFFAFLVPSQEMAFAEGGIAWDPQGVPICEASQTQWNIRMAPDGYGGAIIVWEDYRVGEADIYAQKIDENGVPQWTTDGVAVCNATFSQLKPVIVGDGSGGAIIAWEDWRATYPVIYAVRISSDSGGVHPAWSGASEIKLRDVTTYDQLSPEIAISGQGEAIVVWEETDYSDYSIFAQRIEPSGNLSWTGGLPVNTGTVYKECPRVVRADSDNVIVTWQDYRSNNDYDIYAHRINIPGGNLDTNWDVNGSTVTMAGQDQLGPKIVADGEGGAIITWIDYRNNNGDIYAQRISSGGAQVWTNNGIPICEKQGEQKNPVIIRNLSGGTTIGAIIAWEDMRDDPGDIYADGVDRDEPPLIDEEDTFVAGGIGSQRSIRLVSDNMGGGMGTWIENDRKIFAQRRDENGQPVWSIYPGVLVCEGTQVISDVEIVSDGSGGIIVAWEAGVVAGDYNIFAQRVIDDSVTAYASISGRVIRSDEETAITGVEVEAFEDGGLVSSDFTNTYGYYEVTGLAPGTTYEVRATWTVNGIISSVSMEAFALSYSFDFTLEIDYELGTIAGDVSGVEGKYLASIFSTKSKRIGGLSLQKILSPGSGIAFVELEQRGKVIVRVPVEMDGDYSIPNLLPGRFIARAYNGSIYSKPKTVNLQEGRTLKVNFVFGTIPKETVFNYPNPARSGSTTIRYYCGYGDPEAEIKIYNISGELVRGVRDSEIDDTDAPVYKFLWDCRNSSGMEVASGIYMYIVEVKDNGSGESKKVVKRLAVVR